MTEQASSVLAQTEVTAEDAVKASSVLAQAEVSPPDTTQASSVLLLIEVGPYVRPTETIYEPPIDSAHTPVDGIAQNVETITIYRPSYHAAAGINVDVWKPSIAAGAYVPEGSFLRNLENLQISWSHTIAVDGGYKSASAALAMTRGDVDDWVSAGLGRHIVAYNESQERIFEGLVNKITVNNGPLTHVRGPLVDIINRITVIYTPIDPNTGAKGDTTETPTAEDLNSQRQWGIFEQVVSTGECTDDEAIQYRNLILAEFAQPAQTNDISLGGTGNGSVNLEIVGYSIFLEKFIYTNLSPLFTTASDKLKAVLTAEPNGLFTDFSGVVDNPLVVPEMESNRSATGKSIIDTLVALGDANDLRTFFGIYANRRAIYQSRPTTVYYHQRLADEAHRILDKGGNAILPWNVIPGRWMYIDDFALSAPRPSDLRQDPRALLIEQVSYNAPWGLSIQGSGSVRRLPQFLAKLGLRGSP